MLTIAQIAERYGLTECQVRWRLTQLDGLLRHHLFTGVNGRVTLDDAGVAIFDRLLQLEREGTRTDKRCQAPQWGARARSDGNH
jgi:hypothetical protein